MLAVRGERRRFLEREEGDLLYVMQGYSRGAGHIDDNLKQAHVARDYMTFMACENAMLKGEAYEAKEDAEVI